MTSLTSSIERQLETRNRPPGRPVMFQQWKELLFLHWRVAPEILQQHLPPGLTIDTWDNEAWLGVVPFFMCNIRPWWSIAVPGVSNFLELNLRTYVRDETGRPGVWFFSLDANQKLAVWWARRFFGLPYYHARMQADWDRSTGHVKYQSQRRGSPPAQTCRFEYTPSGPAAPAKTGTLEFYLVERYLLFANPPGPRLYCGQVHHAPYEISDVELRHWDEHVIELAGLPLPGRPPDHAVMSRGVSVDIFPLVPISQKTAPH